MKYFNKARVLDNIEQLFHIRAVPHKWKVKNDLGIDAKPPVVFKQTHHKKVSSFQKIKQIAVDQIDVSKPTQTPIFDPNTVKIVQRRRIEKAQQGSNMSVTTINGR